jgi:hypothetical protein
MWLLDNQRLLQGRDMLLKIELLWQMFFRKLKNIHGKLSPYFTELQKRLENLVAVLKIQMWLSPGATEPILSMFISSSYLGSVSRRK